jgi:hypothetical protein
MKNERLLQATLTGEAVQPIRLYYQIVDKKRLIDKFKQLRCMDFDSVNDRWVWFYAYESKALKFITPYSSIPKEVHPIVIGSFFLRNDDELFLDLRSFERAIEAIPFFDKYVGRSAAQITHAAVVNRLFEAKEQFAPNLDIFFRSEKIAERQPGKRNTPEIEKFPVHFYEDGMNSVKAVLNIRQLMAFEHWKGNAECTLFDVIKTAISGKTASSGIPHVKVIQK